jgi:ethanolamine ammonia-lyase large subunit
MVYQHSVGNFQYSFPDLKSVLAKASPEKSGDEMAGLAVKMNRSGLPLSWFWLIHP